MSRLFSRLENTGQDQNKGAPDVAQSRQNDAPAYADYASASNSTRAGKPATPSLAPGYAISSSLAMSAPPGPVLSRPIWTVRFWFASLLLLVGSSLLTLALPERPLPLATPPAQADAARDKEAADVPNPTPAAAAVPAAPAAIAPLAPALPAGSDTCSDAMLAMNICSKSSP
jgi:hypothetical protein